MAIRSFEQIVREADGTTGKDLARLTVEVARGYPEIHHQDSLAVGYARDLADLEAQRADPSSYEYVETFEDDTRASGFAKCGTRACLAGWTIALHRGVLIDGSRSFFWESVGQREGLSPSDYAAKLLQVESDVFGDQVYAEMDDEVAIEHFARLTGVED